MHIIYIIIYYLFDTQSLKKTDALKSPLNFSTPFVKSVNLHFGPHVGKILELLSRVFFLHEVVLKFDL